MIQQTNNNRLTPLEKLIFDKNNLLLESQNLELKINEDFSYIKKHAGSLVFSGVSSILFPSTKPHASHEDAKPDTHSSKLPVASLGASDYLSIAKGMLPVAWDITRPLLLTWGIKKAQKWLIHFIFKKKK